MIESARFRKDRPLNLLNLLNALNFFGERLVAGHDDGVDDVFYSGSAAEVVDGSCQALEDRAYGAGAGETLYELIGDVARLERGEDEGVGVAGYLAVGSLLLVCMLFPR